MSTELSVANSAQLNHRQATDVAGLCRDIVVNTSQKIQGRNYVRVEGWQSIAAAHGCIASIDSVTEVEGGISATASLIDKDGKIRAKAEGFVGADEKTWAARPKYAQRAMAQTRAISRVCRSAFAHVVVLMNAGLETTPAEEIPQDDTNSFNKVEASKPAPKPVQKVVHESKIIEVPRQAAGEPVSWRDVVIHFGKNKGTTLGQLTEYQLKWYQTKWEPQPYGDKQPTEQDYALRKYLDESMALFSQVPEDIENNTRRNPDVEVEDVPF
jgi:hypothetical protein